MLATDWHNMLCYGLHVVGHQFAMFALGWFRSAVPNFFWHQGLVSWNTVFLQTGNGGDGFGMIQAHYIYCALYFYYYYIVIYNEMYTTHHNAESVGALSLFSLATHWYGFDMSLQAIDVLWSLCSQTSLLMIICICSCSPAPASPPQLHLRSSGIRFS